MPWTMVMTVDYLLLLKDNPSFSEIGVGAPSRRNVSMGYTHYNYTVH